MCVPVSYHLRIQKFMQQVARTAVPGIWHHRVRADPGNVDPRSFRILGSNFSTEEAAKEEFTIGQGLIQPEKTLALHPTSYDILYPSNRQKKQWSIESVIVCQKSSGAPVASTFTFAQHNWFLLDFI